MTTEVMLAFVALASDGLGGPERELADVHH
jgi:hypothetical protein